MKGYYAYIRVSTARQGAEGASLPEQRDAIQRYAARLGLSITQWFEERETAAKSGRPVFARVLTMLKRGRASGLIIHKIDRSARNLGDWAKIGELVDHGITVHFAHDPLDLQSTSGRFAADMQAVVAAHYVRNLSEEVRKGFYGRFRQGIYPLPAPIGYLDQGRGKPKAIDPVRGPLVQDAFRLYVNRGLSLRALRKEMTRRGLRTRAGRAVPLTAYNTMLRNPFYIGKLRLRKTGEMFQGVHEPLVTASMFARAQEILDGKAQPRSRTHECLLRRTLQCGYCSRHLVGEIQKGHTYYRCRTSGCATKCIREEAVEAAVREHLGSIAFTDEDHEALLLLIEQTRGVDATDRAVRLRALRLQMGRLDSKIARLTDAFVDRLIDKPIFERRNGELQLERAQLEEQLREFEDGDRNAIDASLLLLRQVLNVLDRYDEATADERREIIAATTTRITVSGKSVALEPEPHIAKLISLKDGESRSAPSLKLPTARNL